MSIGDHVAVFPVLSCGHCAACTEGAIEACPEARIIGVHVQGAYAQYTVVPAENVFRVPDGLDPRRSAALALAGPVAQNQFHQAGSRPGGSGLVQGASWPGFADVALRSTRRQGDPTSGSADSERHFSSLGPGRARSSRYGFAAEVQTRPGRRHHGRRRRPGPPAADLTATIEVLFRHPGGLVYPPVHSSAGRVELDLLPLYSRSRRVIGVRSAIC